MRKLLPLLICIFLISTLRSQTSSPIISKWVKNTTGKKGSYWAASGTPVTYTFTNSSDSADVLSVCYTTDSVWIRSDGLTNNMGKYLNPGHCYAQNYVFKFPRNPSVPTTKTQAPYVNAAGVLLNGIPIYGLTNSYSWNGSSNVPNGNGVWNVEVYLSEGFVLDTAFGAHPQQQGAYHSHATPWRFYKNLPTNVHSPLVGFAFDGYPVYGPYGYSTPTNSSSAVTRMKTGYSLRNITTRTTLPDGSTASQTGPAVNATYPLGTYVEDYQWLSSNGGDLDEYNGRFCVTPEYPGGTYAYFVTQSSAGVPQFPYYIGTKYYGKPESGNYTTGVVFKIPATANCTGSTTPVGIDKHNTLQPLEIYPNPNNGTFNIVVSYDQQISSEVRVISMLGQEVYRTVLFYGDNDINLPPDTQKGIYFVQTTDKTGRVSGIQKIMVE